MFYTFAERFMPLPGVSQHGLGDLDVALDREHTDGTRVRVRLVKHVAGAIRREEKCHLQVHLELAVVERTQARVQGVLRGLVEVLALLHVALIHGLCRKHVSINAVMAGQVDIVQIVIHNHGDERASRLRHRASRLRHSQGRCRWHRLNLLQRIQRAQSRLTDWLID